MLEDASVPTCKLRSKSSRKGPLDVAMWARMSGKHEEWVSRRSLSQSLISSSLKGRSRITSSALLRCDAMGSDALMASTFHDIIGVADVSMTTA